VKILYFVISLGILYYVVEQTRKKSEVSGTCHALKKGFTFILNFDTGSRKH
jgi:hypothetical protein